MMTQESAIATCSQAIAQAELEQYVTRQAANGAPLLNFQSLEAATQDILRHAEFLSKEKTRSKHEYKQLLSDLGWKGEEKKYLKVAAAFENFSPQELAGVEPATIFLLANNSKKYQPVIDELLDLPEITQAAVRSLIQQQRQPRVPKSENPTIWRQTPDGRRYCQIPPIHEQDEQTGVILQRAMDDGLLPQVVVREAMQLWLDYQQGRLEFVEAAALVSEMPTFVSLEVQYEDLLTEPWLEAIEEQETALSPYSVEEFDKGKHYEGDRADYWTFEPEPEKDDDTVEYGDYAQPFSPHDVQTELEPIELLIHTFQTAQDWCEISEALNIYGEYESRAWEALTPLEKRRVVEIMPEAIKKLTEAKKAGIIVDFKEVRPDVFQVQHQGSIFGEQMRKSGLDTFLAQL